MDTGEKIQALPELESAAFRGIDHIAFAVRDLEAAVEFFQGVLGFHIVRRLETRGKRTGMISAEMEHNGIKFVLCQGTEPESQVSRLVTQFGPGIAHIALAVDDVPTAVDSLRARGLRFDTSVIEGPGLRQAFSSRFADAGFSFELIERNGEHGFLAANVADLFDQLESAEEY
jgi:4-hydroxyphenylpyruvate dioxygenase-like putative hemolysin